MKKKKDSKKKEHFLGNVNKEMKQVRWPKKKEMFKYSFAVLMCIIVLSLFFVLSDLIIAGVKTLVGGV